MNIRHDYMSIEVTLKYCRAASATPSQRASQIADTLLRHCPMLEQLCFHAHEEDELAQLVISTVGTRIDGHFSEALLTWFRSYETSSMIKLHHSETRMHEE
jgi:hypothetical protein